VSPRVGTQTTDEVDADTAPSPRDSQRSHGSTSRFRIGRWFLFVEGFAVAEMAGISMVGNGIPPVGPTTGFTPLGLVLTPLRSVLLVAFGAVAVVATLNRRATTIVTAAALIASLLLTALGDVALATGAPVLWGVDPRNVGLYALLLAYNAALLTWLLPDEFGATPNSPDTRGDLRS
jgi:hypothetical protein